MNHEEYNSNISPYSTFYIPSSSLWYTDSMEIIHKAREGVRQTKQEFFGQTLTLLNGAFALIAALAWNEAVKGLIDTYFKSGSKVYSRFLYAFIITLIVVIVTTRLNKISKKYKQEPEQIKE